MKAQFDLYLNSEQMIDFSLQVNDEKLNKQQSATL